MLYRASSGCLWLIMGAGGAWALREAGSGPGGYALLAVVWLAGLAYVFRARVPRELPPPEIVQAKVLPPEPQPQAGKQKADEEFLSPTYSLREYVRHLAEKQKADEGPSPTQPCNLDKPQPREPFPGRPGWERLDAIPSDEPAGAMDDDEDSECLLEADDDFDDALEAESAPEPQPATRGMRTEQPAIPASAPAPLPEERWRAAMAAPKSKAARRAAAPASRTAQLTVRYYSRMRKEQVYPLHVALSESEIRELRQKTIAQAKAVGLQVREDSVVTVRPEIPGCDCQPGVQTLLVGSGPLTTVTFHVTPWAKGTLHGARLLASVDGREVAQIPLQMKVVQGHTLAVLSMMLGWGVSVGVVLLECFGLDLKTQVNQGFAGWQGMANNALQLAAAETSKLLLAGGLLILLSAWWFGWRIIRREDPAQFVLLEPKPAPQPVG